MILSNTETISVDSYEMKVVEYEYVKINNNSDIFSKMVAKMAAENLILIFFINIFLDYIHSDVSQFCFQVQKRMRCLFI